MFKCRGPVLCSERNAGEPAPHQVEFHHIKPEYAKNSLSKALLTGLITDDDRTLIEQHVAWVTVTSNLSMGRINKITFHLVKWRRFLKPFRANTIEDVYAGITELKNARIHGRPYSPNTLRDDISILKRFYLWMIRKGYTTISKGEIKELKVPHGKMMTKTAGQMLSEAEVRAMIQACTRSIDRALVATVYEAALRIKELGTIKWDQVRFEKNNVILNVDVKTGRPRHIPLFMARPYLAAWRADYPLKPEGNAYVFISEREKKPLRYQALEKRLKILAERAGVTKKITPHIVRHSRITNLVRRGVREYTIREIAWGNQGTKMLQTYSHLVNDDVDSELSQLYGITPDNVQKDDAMHPRQCPRCALINAPATNYCASCGVPLTPEARVTIDELTTEIETHPLYRVIMNKIEQMLTSQPTNNFYVTGKD